MIINTAFVGLHPERDSLPSFKEQAAALDVFALSLAAEAPEAYPHLISETNADAVRSIMGRIATHALRTELEFTPEVLRFIVLVSQDPAEATARIKEHARFTSDLQDGVFEKTIWADYMYNNWPAVQRLKEAECLGPFDLKNLSPDTLIGLEAEIVGDAIELDRLQATDEADPQRIAGLYWSMETKGHILSAVRTGVVNASLAEQLDPTDVSSSPFVDEAGFDRDLCDRLQAVGGTMLTLHDISEFTETELRETFILDDASISQVHLVLRDHHTGLWPDTLVDL